MLSEPTFKALLEDSINMHPEDVSMLYGLLSKNTPEGVPPRKLIEAINKVRDPSVRSSLPAKEFFDPSQKMAKKQRPKMTESAIDDQFGQILTKILSSQKHGLEAYFRNLIEQAGLQGQDAQKGIDIDLAKDLASQIFKDRLTEEEIDVFKDGMDRDNDCKVSVREIVEVVKRGMEDPMDRIQTHFSVQAMLLDQRKASSRDYFFDYGIYDDRDYQATDQQFKKALQDSLYFSPNEAQEVIEIMADGTPLVAGADIIACTDSYRSDLPESSKGPNPPQESTSSKIPPAAASAPIRVMDMDEKKRKELFDRVKRALRKRKLSAIHLYSIADVEENEVVSVITLKNTYQQMLPEIDMQSLIAFMKILDRNQNGFLEREEYELAMLDNENDLKEIESNDSRIDLSKSRLSSMRSSQASLKAPSIHSAHSQAISDRQPAAYQTAFGPGEHFTEDDLPDLLKELGHHMHNAQYSPEEVYNAVGEDEEEVSSVVLMKYLKDIVGTSMSHQRLALAVKSMDTSRNGTISKNEFLVGCRYDPKFTPIPSATPAPKRPVAVIRTPSSKGSVVRPGSRGSVLSGTPASRKSATVMKSISKPPSVKKIQVDDLSDQDFSSQVRFLKTQMIEKNVDLKAILASLSMDPMKTRQQYASMTNSDPSVISSAGFVNALHRQLPNIPLKTLSSIVRYADPLRQGFISREELELMLAYNKDSETIEISQVLEPGQFPEIDFDAIKKMRQILKSRGIAHDAAFNYCDSDKNGFNNILDLKIGLEKLLPCDREGFDTLICFLKELKSVFKLKSISRDDFMVFLDNPQRIKNMKEYDNQREDIHQEDSGRELEQALSIVKDYAKKNMEGITMAQVAENYDRDYDRMLSIMEFNQFLDELCENSLKPIQKKLLFKLADKDKNGTVNYDEFFEFLERDIKLEEVVAKSQDEQK